MIFKTKAETLKALEGLLKHGQVLPQFCFTSEMWDIEAKNVLDALWDNYPEWIDQPLIVRSSGQAEDSLVESLAGHFESVANVVGKESILSAINTVHQSFSGENPKDQIFIQPMLNKNFVSGVAFTRDPSNAGYYNIINFDDQSGATDTVTRGASNNLRTCYHAKSTKPPGNRWLSQLLLLLAELEKLFCNDALDVEFAIDHQGILYLLQVRPLILNSETSLSNDDHRKLLSEIENRYIALSKSHPYLLGEKTIFGVMPDWNPAEIVGIRPRPLALSLYKELITDGTWAYQRDNYGYRNLRSFPLLVSFSGLPYIDVRISFNSFIPADLKSELADRLVNYYLDSLLGSPSNHDKVEFEIIYSCYTLDLPERISELKKAGFDQDDCDEISESLRVLTNGIIHSVSGLWEKDIIKLDELKSRQTQISSSQLTPVEKIYWLIEDCKRYGTLPFAGLARAGFIAVQLLQSMVRVGVLTANEYERFMASLNTVSSNMQTDLGEGKDIFLKKYGHLRPGTYDILSPRYDESPDLYFDWDNTYCSEQGDTPRDPFKLSIETMKHLEDLLIEHRLEHNVLSLFDFIKRAIEGREYAKFIFTKSLSDSLLLITQLGKEHDIDLEDLSYADITFINKVYSSCDNIKESMLASIEDGKHKYSNTCALTLPPLITCKEEISSFELPKNEPNYITLKAVQGKVVLENSLKKDLYGNILMIQSADPGYDWIFSHGIGGFITMYGGANSHMAIRAAELGIPAVIGVGEVLYQQWVKSNTLEVDCSNKKVHIIR
jgi:glutamine kinase